MRLFTRRAERQKTSDHADARLEDAERNLRDLQTRGENAVRMLDTRHRRNSWREAVQEMIQGGSSV